MDRRLDHSRPPATLGHAVAHIGWTTPALAAGLGRAIALLVRGSRSAIELLGAPFWQPADASGVPVAAIVALAIVTLVRFVVTRRRRAAAAGKPRQAWQAVPAEPVLGSPARGR